MSASAYGWRRAGPRFAQPGGDDELERQRTGLGGGVTAEKHIRHIAYRTPRNIDGVNIADIERHVSHRLLESEIKNIPGNADGKRGEREQEHTQYSEAVFELKVAIYAGQTYAAVRLCSSCSFDINRCRCSLNLCPGLRIPGVRMNHDQRKGHKKDPKHNEK